jgi:hypothetical protein
MTVAGFGGASWRSPVLAPLYACGAAFLLAGVVGLVGDEEPPGPPVVLDAGPAPAPAEFRAAVDGRPTLEIRSGEADGIAQITWKIIRPEGHEGPSEVTPGEEPDTALRPTGSLVDSQLCALVPEGWTVRVPPDAPDLDPSPQQACRGGWNDPRVVPAQLAFEVVRGS